MLTVDTSVFGESEHTLKLLSSVSTAHSRCSDADKDIQIPTQPVQVVEIPSPGMHKPPAATGITHKMLVKLIDWLATLCWSYRIDDDALFLTVELLRKAVHRQQIDRSKLQGFGAVSLLLSCKYTSQKKRFTLLQISQACRNLYSQSDLMEMQAAVLESVGFDLELRHQHRCLEEFLETFPRKVEPPQKLRLSFLLEGQLLLYECVGEMSQINCMNELIEFVSQGTVSSFVRELVECLLTTNYKTLMHRHSERFDAESYLSQIKGELAL